MPLSDCDHSLISLNYDCVVEKDTDDCQINNSFYNGDYDVMREEYEENKLSWENRPKDLNTQGIWDTFPGKINGLIKRYVPKKKYTNVKSPPWYGREIRTLSKN